MCMVPPQGLLRCLAFVWVATVPLSSAQPAPPMQSVSAYLVTEVPTAAVRETAGTLVERLKGRRFATVDHIFLVDEEGRLRGVAPLVAVLAAGPAVALEALAVRDWPTVAADVDREDAASLAIHKAVSALAVCGAGGRFVGAVPASALLSILRDEHLEDLHH